MVREHIKARRQGPDRGSGLFCEAVGSLPAWEVFSAIPDSFAQRPAPKSANDARNESPNLLARYRDALRACLAHDLRRSRSPGKVAFPGRGCLCPDRLVRLPLQFWGVPALLFNHVEQFFVAEFRHDDLSLLSPTRRKVLHPRSTIKHARHRCHRQSRLSRGPYTLSL